jgi:hypothetical protein
MPILNAPEECMKAFRIVPVLLVLLCGLHTAQAQKLKAEEIIAKHVEAIGGAETLQSITSRISSGSAMVTFKEPGTGQLGGRAVLASESGKNVMAMVFDNATNYPHEKVGFDGSDVSGSYVRPGVRSTLGDFLLTHKAIIKQGIWGGTLSQSWALLDPARNKVKVESSGTKKINNRLMHQLKLYPSGSDLKISVFFDAETFQHVRTEYERSIAGQMGATPESSASQSETRYKLSEDFSDFKKEGGLMLPHAYKIHLEILGRSGSFKADWEMALSDFQFNQRIDPTSFDVDDKK